MRVTAQEELGLRCLMRVAQEGAEEPVPAQRVAEIEGITLAYAQKILRLLARHALIRAHRGANGGYTLNRSAQQTTLADVLRALGGPIDLVELCERQGQSQEVCRHHGACSIRPVWKQISALVESVLEQIPLATLLEEQALVTQHLSAAIRDITVATSAPAAEEGAS